MKKALLLLLLPLLIHLSASAQQAPATSANAGTSDKMLNASVEFDQKRFNLTSEQTVQDRKVLTDYYRKSNLILQNKSQSIDQLKAATKKMSLELAQGYKGFLNSEQYNHFLTTYNKLHPNDQIH